MPFTIVATNIDEMARWFHETRRKKAVAMPDIPDGALVKKTWDEFPEYNQQLLKETLLEMSRNPVIPQPVAPKP